MFYCFLEIILSTLFSTGFPRLLVYSIEKINSSDQETICFFGSAKNYFKCNIPPLHFLGFYHLQLLKSSHSYHLDLVDRAQAQFLPFEHDFGDWLFSLFFWTLDMFPFLRDKLQLIYSQEGKFVCLLLIVRNFYLLFGFEVLEDAHVDTLTSPDVIFEKY